MKIQLITISLACLVCLQGTSAGEVPGSLSGQFQFSKAGQAGYQIPLRTPPGRAGLQPQLGLSYNSAGGNGSVGLGWQLITGLSSISRVGQNYDLDGQIRPVMLPGNGNFESDRLAMDGNRLMLTSGVYGAHNSTYQTHLETLNKVTAVDENTQLPGPEQFVVQTKDGFVMRYGEFVHHRIQAGAWDTPVLSWLLSSITDPYGNTLTVDYLKCPDASDPLCGTGRLEYLPTVIHYEGRTIRFVYEQRPDQKHYYRAGSPFSQTLRLKRINVYVNQDGDTNVTENEDFAYAYALDYAAPASGNLNPQSRLEAVTMLDADGNQFPATTFAWLGDNAQVGFSEFAGLGDNSLPLFAKVKTWANQQFNGKYNEGTHLIDLNGDGLKDLIQGVYRGESSQGNDATIERQIFLNRRTHWEALPASHPYIQTWNTTGSGALFAARSNMDGNHPGGDLGTRFSDMNGDGLPDLIQLVDGRKAGHDQLSKPQTRPRILINQGEDLGWQVIDENHPWLSQIPKHASGDPDLYFSKLYREQEYHQGSVNGGTELADLDGDGRPDLFQWIKDNNVNRVRIFLNKGPDQTTGGWQTQHAYADSIQGLLNNPSWNNRSFFAEDVFGSGNQSSWRGSTGMHLQDVNGDGLPDLIHLNQGRGNYPTITQVALNRGPQQGFVFDAAYSNSIPTGENAPLFVSCSEGSNQVRTLGTRLFDVNGDGLSDLLRLYQDGDQPSIQSLYLNTGKTFVSATQWQMPGDDAVFTYIDGFSRDGGTRMADFNADGLVDLMVLFYDQAGNHRRNLYLQEQSETRQGWYPIEQNTGQRNALTGIPSDLYFTGTADGESFDMGTRIDDVNGDGRLDLVQLVHVDGVYQKRRFLLGQYKTSQLANGETVYQTAVNRIETIRDGLGGLSQFEYNPLTLGSELFTQSTGAQYPYRDLVPQRQVLSAYHTYQPMAGDATPQHHTMKYKYNGYRLKLDIPNNGQPGLDGGGNLGFTTVTQVDETKGLAITSEYEQVQYPFYGRLIKRSQSTTEPTSRLIGEATYSYDMRANMPSSQGKTYFVHLSKTDRSFYENGAHVYTTRVSTIYDAFGYPIRETHSGDIVSPYDNTYIHTRFINSISDWRFGISDLKVHSTSGDFNNLAARQHVTDLDYDDQYRLTQSKIVNLNGGEDQVTLFEHDAYGNLIRQTGAMGLVTEREFDTVFNFFPTSTAMDPAGLNHRIEMVTEPIFGNTVSTVDVNGIMDEVRYDGFGRKTAVLVEDEHTNQLVVQNQIAYYWAKTQTKEGLRLVTTKGKNWDAPLSESWLKHTAWHDTWGRVYRLKKEGSSDSQIINLYTKYDSAGRVSAKSLPTDDGNLFWERYSYDHKGRQVEIEYPTANPNDPVEIETYAYGYLTRSGRNLTTTTHRARHIRGQDVGKQTTLLMDARERVIERRFLEEDLGESNMFYKYDGLDRPVQIFSQENAHGERVRFRAKYDSLNRKLWNYEEIVIPNSNNGGWTVLERKEDHYDHNILGHVTAVLDGNGNRIEYTYDLLNRKTLERLVPVNPPSDGELVEIRFTHDANEPYAIGRVSQVEGLDLHGTTLFQYNFAYNKHGQHIQQIMRFDDLDPFTHQYEYRMDGLPLAIELPDGSTLSRSYTGLNRAASITLDEPDHPARVHVAWQDYNAAGSPGRVVYGNGVVTEYTHEPHTLRLETMATFDSSDTLIADKSYFWNANGQIAEILDEVYHDQDQSFEYDRLNRLVFAQGVFGSRDYSYDTAGNMLTKGDKVFEDFTGFRLDSGFDTATGQVLNYAYDANGNQIARNIIGTDEFFEYDAYDRLVNYFRQAPNGSMISNSYRYDHTGRRYLKQDSDGGKTYYVSPGYEVFIKDNLEQVTKYVFGSAGKIAQVTTLMGPDLEVSIRSARPLAYNRYNVELVVRNIGDRATTNTCLLNLRTDLGYAEQQVDPIAVGGHRRIFIEIAGSANAAAMAVVDADFQISEKDEDNNVFSYNISTGPDLTFTEVDMVALSQTRAEMRMTIVNAGQGPSIATTVQFGMGQFAEPFALSALAPGETVTFQRNISLPSMTLRGLEYRFDIDPDQLVAETVEDNNHRDFVLHFPDYTVTGLTIFPAKTLGQVNFEVSVTNLADGGPSEVTLIVENTAIRTSASQQVFLGKPGVAKKVTGTLSGHLEQSFKARVNPNQSIYESNFNNNEVLSFSVTGEVIFKHAGD